MQSLNGELDYALIIGQEGCSACKIAKEAFEKMKIPFLYQDIDSLDLTFSRMLVDLRKKNQIKKMSIPLIFFKKQTYMGFSYEIFEKAGVQWTSENETATL